MRFLVDNNLSPVLVDRARVSDQQVVDLDAVGNIAERQLGRGNEANSSQTLASTAEPWPKSPWFTATPTLAFFTCRSPA